MKKLSNWLLGIKSRAEESAKAHRIEWKSAGHYDHMKLTQGYTRNSSLLLGWSRCECCGHQEVKSQPFSLGGPCSKCGGSQIAEVGTCAPDWFEEKEQ